MRFKHFYLSLNPKQREDFCNRAGLSHHFVRYGLLSTNPRFKRNPSPETLDRLFEAGAGAFSYTELLCDFFPLLRTEVQMLERRINDLETRLFTGSKSEGGSDGRPRPIDTTAATETTGDQSNRVTADQDRHEG